MTSQLVKAARAALAALETPGDLTPEELGYVIEDLDRVLQLYCEGCDRLGEPQHDLDRVTVLACGHPLTCDNTEPWEVDRLA